MGIVLKKCKFNPKKIELKMDYEKIFFSFPKLILNLRIITIIKILNV